MIQLAISILWLVIGIVVLLAVIYLALYVIKLFIAIPDVIEKMIWAVALILCLIGVLTLLAGGGNMHFPRVGELEPIGTVAALSIAPA